MKLTTQRMYTIKPKNAYATNLNGCNVLIELNNNSITESIMEGLRQKENNEYLERQKIFLECLLSREKMLQNGTI